MKKPAPKKKKPAPQKSGSDTGQLRAEIATLQELLSVYEKAVLKDIAERQRAEAALRESEDRWRRLVAMSPDAIYINRTGRIVFINEAGLRLFGAKSPDEILGKSPLDFVHPDSQALVKERIRRVHETGEPAPLVEQKAIRLDGRIVDIEVAASPFLDGGTTAIQVVLREITERKRAEEALRQSEERFELCVEGADVGIWDWNIVTNDVYYSPRFKKLLGYEDDELPNEYATWEERIHPEDREMVLTALDAHLKQRIPYAIEYRMQTKTGEYKWYSARGQAIWDESGRPIRMSGSEACVTQRKRLEEQLRQAAKMEAVGRLAGGVAHDFNNLLTVITGYTDLLLQTSSVDDAARAQLHEVKKAGDRAASLTSQLLAFSRRQVIQPQDVDLHLLVSNLEGMLPRLIGEHIRLVTRQDSAQGFVKADPGQLEQVVINLAVNARDAMPDGGILTIETANVDVTFSGSRSGAQAFSGPGVRMTVTDTGHGMDPDTISHIFEPFFTTKEIGQGTGLGLATVYGIVTQSGGTVEVTSEKGQGTTFTIWLPRVHAPAPVTTAQPPAVRARGSETVLVVEDESIVRAFVRDILRMQGYQVMEAANGEEAIRLCETYGPDIHLLLTDVIMPGLNGRRLAERAAAKRPDMKVLFMSGYTDDIVLRLGVRDTKVAFIQKPFSPDGLAARVREVLDTAADRHAT